MAVSPIVDDQNSVPSISARLDTPVPTFQMPSNFPEAEARTAILDHADKSCCWGTKPAQEMTFTGCTETTALHYSLNSFTEHRSSRRECEPLTESGATSKIESAKYNLAPAVWDVQIEPERMFYDHTQRFELPFSSRKVRCGKCWGWGTLSCKNCTGGRWFGGTVSCERCSGGQMVIGQRKNDDGFWVDVYGRCTRDGCSGGRIQCPVCKGSGTRECTTCYGIGNLREYTLVTCRFRNHYDHFVWNQTDMKDKLITEADGTFLFVRTAENVVPIQNYEVNEINIASMTLVERHNNAWTPYIIQQRHFLQSVPIFEIDYHWKEKPKRLWVYGDERAVYAPNYPARFFWGLCCVF